jgi:hypothetical protein
VYDDHVEFEVVSTEVTYMYETGTPPSNVRTVKGGYATTLPPIPDRPEGGAKLATVAMTPVPSVE